jgi:hypothetical protein
MPRKEPDRDPIATYQRRSLAQQRVGVDARCACGESRPEALITGTTPIICAECKRKSEGRSTTDQHHPAAKASNPARTPIPANDHRAVLSTGQYEWPQSTIENQDGSPLIAAAAGVRGFRDTNAYLDEKLLSPTPEFLEELDRFMIKTLGPKWWIGTELERFSPTRRR